MSILNGCEFRGLRKTLGQKARVFTRNDFGFLDLHIISFAFVSSIFRTIQAELVTVPSAFSPRINKKAKAGERLTRIQGSLETGGVQFPNQSGNPPWRSQKAAGLTIGYRSEGARRSLSPVTR